MKKIVSILRLDFLPEKVDWALLLLRVWLGGSMLVLHGWQKLSTFQQMSRGFSDPLRIGSQASLGLAVFGEVVCSLLLIFGFFARTGALGGAVTMGIALFMVHDGKPKGAGELAFVYLAGFLAILLAGPGRYALDRSAGKSAGSAPKKPKPAK